MYRKLRKPKSSVWHWQRIILNNKTIKAHCLSAALKLKSKVWLCCNICEQNGTFKTRNFKCLFSTCQLRILLIKTAQIYLKLNFCVELRTKTPWVFHCKYTSILHRFRDINAYLPKNKTSCDFDHVNTSIFPGYNREQNLTILSLAIPDKFKGCTILKWITWPGPRFFQGRLVVRRLTLDIAYNHTKFDDSSSAVPEIFHGLWNSRMGNMTLTTQLGDILVIRRLVLSWPNRAHNLRSVTLAVPKIFHGV